MIVRNTPDGFRHFYRDDEPDAEGFARFIEEDVSDADNGEEEAMTGGLNPLLEGTVIGAASEAQERHQREQLAKKLARKKREC